MEKFKKQLIITRGAKVAISIYDQVIDENKVDKNLKYSKTSQEQVIYSPGFFAWLFK